MKPWIVTPERFLRPEDASRLLAVVRDRADLGRLRGRRAPVVEEIVVRLGLEAGLRLGEMAALDVGDLPPRGSDRLTIRRGKGGRPGLVPLGEEPRKRLREFLSWKRERGEALGADAPLLLTPRKGRFTVRGLEKIVARAYAAAGIEGHRAHDLRHTYATIALRATRDVVTVRDLLRHRDVRTTQVYAQVLSEDLGAAAEAVSRALSSSSPGKTNSVARDDELERRVGRGNTNSQRRGAQPPRDEARR